MKFDYLLNKTERDVRVALVSGLAVLKKRTPSRVSFDYMQVVYQVALAFSLPDPSGIAKTWNDYQVGYSESPQGDDEHPDNKKLLSVIWGLIGEGVLAPRLRVWRDGHPLRVDRLMLTELGERVLAGGDEHPLHPGFIKRFQTRAPSMSPEVVARMEDAVSCLEKALLRPALVMIGLASEETLRVSHAAMVNLAYIGKAAAARANAKDVLDDIQKAMPSWPQQNDEQHRLTKAIAAAEAIRTERNKASHPGVVLSDAAAVEELLVLAARQVPVFWEVCIEKAVTTNGFVVS